MTDEDEISHEVALRWCAKQGANWKVVNQAGRGGTAPVFRVQVQSDCYALKIYDLDFSSGRRGEVEEKRILKQLELGAHDCPYIVKFIDGGRFEDRLILLMNVAPGRELEKVLHLVPPNEVRGIVDRVAKACAFLRTRDICHRDIKSANIFVSDDFKQVTLLDLSVMRDIYDPVGLGTDHGNQLPVVATARYSPPEYLFRLEDYSPEFWHGIDVYQLGGLLHDLIMRRPMFSREYGESKENRYRFAWIVAKTIPEVNSPEVDQDLIVLAKRALDKNWTRRRRIQIEDFFDETSIRRKHALASLGLGPKRERLVINRKGARAAKLSAFASELEGLFTERLRASGVTAVHQIKPKGHPLREHICFEWDADFLEEKRYVKLDVMLTATEDDDFLFGGDLTLVLETNGDSRSGHAPLADVAATSDNVASLTDQIILLTAAIVQDLDRAGGK